MNINFYKYQGTGNDFILIDDREAKYSGLTQSQISFLCNRRFGIGADGLILLQEEKDYDFKMKYFNADGNESTMCGNGGRCVVKFAHDLNIISEKTCFVAIDGPHNAEVKNQLVRLKMKDVSEIKQVDDSFILNTGSPHYVTFVDDADDINVFFEGKKIRYSEPFNKEGINVNFVAKTDDGIIVRTYERGVENETFSCGTGVVASAIVNAIIEKTQENSINIKTLGGTLKVELNRNEKGFDNIWLIGPAEYVFKGQIELK